MTCAVFGSSVVLIIASFFFYFFFFLSLCLEEWQGHTAGFPFCVTVHVVVLAALSVIEVIFIHAVGEINHISAG